MNKIKIGTIYGKNIYIGNPIQLKNGEYYISTEGRNLSGLFVKMNCELVPVCKCNKTENVVSEPNLQDVSILGNLHGKQEKIQPAEGYDGIGTITYRKPKIEEKDTVMIKKDGITEIKVGKGYDGMSDVTVIVNIENNE